MIGTDAKALEAVGGSALLLDVGNPQQDVPLPLPAAEPHWATRELLLAVVAHPKTVVRLCVGVPDT